jgi:hypothetical protein
MTRTGVRRTVVRDRMSLAREKSRLQAQATTFAKTVEQRHDRADSQRAPRHGY